jgi:hypothetical protein
MIAGTLHPSPPNLSTYLRLVGVRIHHREFSDLLLTCRSFWGRFPLLTIGPFCGYLSALVAADASGESDFHGRVTCTFCSELDLPQHVHLLEELSLGDPKRPPPLLRLLMGDVDCPRRPAPFLTSSMDRHVEFVGAAALPGRPDHIGALIGAMDAAVVPVLRPVPEGCDEIPFEDSVEIGKLVTTGQWAKLVSVANAVLESQPSNLDMIFHRMIALTRLNKITDAIIECTKLLQVWPSKEMQEFKRSLWKLLGRADVGSDEQLAKT